ncbi:MAG: large conductance mechanosensitive channel protein MscL, partial [Clostridiales bacterium]|nr:large conductance mechanosensitive channel protein MscL [Clostridiales bacterium]
AELAPAISVNYGNLISVILDFIIIAFAIFCVVKAINKARALTEKQEEEAPAAPPEPSAEEKLLTEIRDLLKNK